MKKRVIEYSSEFNTIIKIGNIYLTLDDNSIKEIRNLQADEFNAVKDLLENNDIVYFDIENSWLFTDPGQQINIA